MAKSLPSRPNLDHLRRQAKQLLSQLNEGAPAAARAFIEFLPEAKRLTPAKVKAAGYRLADAQSVVARKSGFASWPQLSRHVEQLRALEGEWHFVSLEIDGHVLPGGASGQSTLIIDGDRFRMESPEANYEGEFNIDVGDVGEQPARIDIEFVEGPEAGNWSYGIYELDGDRLTMCLGLVGASRPVGFTTSPGSGHALERLRRAAKGTRLPAPAARANGAKAAQAPSTPAVDPGSFDVPMTPLLRRLEGEWAAIDLVRDGKPMPAEWLSFGSRVMTGNEVKVVFGGQVMVHAKVRIDEGATPAAVDYLNLNGSAKGKVSFGIMDWVGDDARFLMAAPGQPRPQAFSAGAAGQTLSRWRKRSKT